jgi:uncharacterized protein YbjT (DUF2867 family)
MEKLILSRDLDFVFLRPSYFMQNLTTTLVQEIRTKDTIFIPSGKLKFTWVDARDIGKVGARILEEFESFRNRSFVITGKEQKAFHEVSAMLSRILGREIHYVSPSLLKFYGVKRRLGIQPAMIFVMIMLHYLPRFSKKTNPITTTVRDLCGEEPGTLEEFIHRERSKFLP